MSGQEDVKLLKDIVKCLHKLLDHQLSIIKEKASDESVEDALFYVKRATNEAEHINNLIKDIEFLQDVAHQNNEVLTLVGIPKETIPPDEVERENNEQTT